MTTATDLLFVTDGDLDISGNLDAGDPVTAAGQMLVHEQVNLRGIPLAWRTAPRRRRGERRP